MHEAESSHGVTRDSNLKATEYFEVVARLGTVTKAATELGVSPSAVSQQVRLLEEQFGVKLFRREKRRLVLILDGDRLFQTTSQAFSAIRNAGNTIVRQRETRNLTVRVSSRGEWPVWRSYAAARILSLNARQPVATS